MRLWFFFSGCELRLNITHLHLYLKLWLLTVWIRSSWSISLASGCTLIIVMVTVADTTTSIAKISSFITTAFCSLTLFNIFFSSNLLFTFSILLLKLLKIYFLFELLDLFMHSIALSLFSSKNLLFSSFWFQIFNSEW